jgi:hypothetical protein
MNKQEEEQEKMKICDGGVHCLQIEDKEHSNKFIHLQPVNTLSLFSLTHSHLICLLSLFFDCLFFIVEYELID